MSENPSKRFGLDVKIEEGQKANLSVFDLDNEYEITAQNFYSMGKSSPFDREKVFGKCEMTFCGGKKVYDNGKFSK